MASNTENIDALMQEALRLLRESDQMYEAATLDGVPKQEAIRKIHALNETALELTNKALAIADSNGQPAREELSSRARRAD